MGEDRKGAEGKVGRMKADTVWTGSPAELLQLVDEEVIQNR